MQTFDGLSNCHVSVDGGAGGPAAADCGSSQRQRAVGEGESHRPGPTCGHGHIDHPDLSVFSIIKHIHRFPEHL